MEILRSGSRGFKVQLLQRLLNKANRRTGGTGGRSGPAALAEDGIFGPLTAAAVSAFKSRARLSPSDPVAGAGTWSRLGIVVEKEHPITLIGQPTSTSCWAAAAMMILGNQSVGPGSALLSGGGLLPGIDNINLFAQSMGWRMLNETPSVNTLVDHVVNGPVWIVGSGSNFAHAVVLSGVYSDRASAGDGTMFRVHDPWPIGVGKVYGSFSNPLTMFDASGTTRIPASLTNVVLTR